MNLPDSPPPRLRRRVRADALERADTAWRARVAGATWAEAAQVAGFTDRDNAQRAVRNVYGALPQPERADLRALWRDRLELAWRQVVDDMTQQRPGATTAAVRITTCAIQLDGLAEPTKVDLQVSETFESLLRELEANDL